jgi:hypothetical protein
MSDVIPHAVIPRADRQATRIAIEAFFASVAVSAAG